MKADRAERCLEKSPRGVHGRQQDIRLIDGKSARRWDVQSGERVARLDFDTQPRQHAQRQAPAHEDPGLLAQVENDGPGLAAHPDGIEKVVQRQVTAGEARQADLPRGGGGA